MFQVSYLDEGKIKRVTLKGISFSKALRVAQALKGTLIKGGAQ